ELCVPRAVHEGWLRESDEQSVSLPPLRPRRGRSLLDRLHVPVRVRQLARQGHADSELRGLSRRQAREADPAADLQPYDFLDRGETVGAAEPAGSDPGRAGDGDALDAEGAAAAAEQREPPAALDRALELFNLS